MSKTHQTQPKRFLQKFHIATSWFLLLAITANFCNSFIVNHAYASIKSAHSSSLGVLALNFDQSSYGVGQTVDISMAVLDINGEIVCDAELSLEITNPKQQTQILSTKAGSITASKTCQDKFAVSDPGYQATFIPSALGNYQAKLTAKTKQDSRVTTQNFQVAGKVPLVIKRHNTATRIYPVMPYEVHTTITANDDINDAVVLDKVPASFEITSVEPAGLVKKASDGQTIEWSNLSLSHGQTVELSYTYKAPQISPELYVLGPVLLIDARLGKEIFAESRPWQIAADTVITGTVLTQGGDTTNYSASYTTASFTPTQNYLVLAWVVTTQSKTYGTPPIPTMTGGGEANWVYVNSVTFNTTATPLSRLTLFRALNTGVPVGAPASIFAGNSVGGSPSGCAWVISQYNDVDTSGADGAGAVVQSKTGRADTGNPTVTLNALADIQNLTAGGFANINTSGFTAGTNYTAYTGATYATPDTGINAERWTGAGTASTTVNATQTSEAWGEIAVEIKNVLSVPTLGEILFLALIGCMVFLGVKSGVIKIKPTKNEPIDKKPPQDIPPVLPNIRHQIRSIDGIRKIPRKEL